MTDFTKISLAMALEDLLKKRPLSELTVKDISDRAGVNRQTFYYHFKNINDLLKWTVARGFEDFFKHCEENNYRWDDGIIFLSKELKENRKAIVNAYSSIDTRSFRSSTYTYFKPLVEDLLSSNEKAEKLSKEKRESVTHFFLDMYVGFFFSWLESENIIDEKKMRSTLLRYISASLDAVLESEIRQS